MTIEPLFDRVEIRPIGKKSAFKNVSDEFEEMGEVIAVSPYATGVSVGDTIFYYGHSVFETPEIDGVRHYFVPFNDQCVFGVMKP